MNAQERHNQEIEDLNNLLFFLRWAKREDPGMMWGGVTVNDAYHAACRLAGIDAFQFEIMCEDKNL